MRPPTQDVSIRTGLRTDLTITNDASHIFLRGSEAKESKESACITKPKECEADRHKRMHNHIINTLKAAYEKQPGVSKSWDMANAYYRTKLDTSPGQSSNWCSDAVSSAIDLTISDTDAVPDLADSESDCSDGELDMPALESRYGDNSPTLGSKTTVTGDLNDSVHSSDTTIEYTDDLHIVQAMADAEWKHPIQQPKGTTEKK